MRSSIFFLFILSLKIPTLHMFSFSTSLHQVKILNNIFLRFLNNISLFSFDSTPSDSFILLSGFLLDILWITLFPNWENFDNYKHDWYRTSGIYYSLRDTIISGWTTLIIFLHWLLTQIADISLELNMIEKLDIKIQLDTQNNASSYVSEDLYLHQYDKVNWAKKVFKTLI